MKEIFLLAVGKVWYGKKILKNNYFLVDYQD